MSGEDVVPLVVDLDDTLIRGDLLLECLLKGMRMAPLPTLGLLLNNFRKPQVLKARLGARYAPDLSRLMLDRDVKNELEAARNSGRPVVLASGSNQALVQEFAGLHGPFDHVYASDEVTNLTSSRKAAVLYDKFGAQGFDYIGDSAKDIAVWKVARTAYVTRRGSRFHGRMRREGLDPVPLGVAPGWADANWAMRLNGAALLLGAIMLTLWIARTMLPMPAPSHILGFALIAIAGQSYLDLLHIDTLRKRGQPGSGPAFAAGRVPLHLGIGYVLGAGALGLTIVLAHGGVGALLAIGLLALLVLFPRGFLSAV